MYAFYSLPPIVVGHSNIGDPPSSKTVFHEIVDDDNRLSFIVLPVTAFVIDICF